MILACAPVSGYHKPRVFYNGLIMLKQLLLSLMLLCVAGTAVASVFDVQLDAAPYSREQAREQAVDVLLSRLAGEQGPVSWVRDEILNNWSRYSESAPAAGGYRVQFSGAELSPLLHSAGLRVWTGKRPTLLIWQVQDGRVKDMPDTGWREASRQYAIPLLWPLWDLQEHMQVDKSALSGNSLAEASQRYGAGMWLAVQQQEAGLNWRLYDKSSGQPLTRGQARSATELLAAVNDYWIVHQAAEPVQQPENHAPAEALQAGNDAPGELTIVVTGLKQFSDVVRLEQRLSRLEGITQINVLDSAGDQARFRLVLSSPSASPALSRAGLSALGDRRYRLEQMQ